VRQPPARAPGPPAGLGLLDTSAALAVVVIWAFNFVAGKVGVTQVPPLLLLALRFGLVAVLLAPFLKPLGRRRLRVIALSFVFGSLHFGPLFIGLQGVDAGPAAIAGQLIVPFSALLAFVLYRERLGRWQGLGMAIAFGGVYLLAGDPAGTFSRPHFLAIVGASFAWAVANILIKRLGPINVFQLNAWIAWSACPQLLVGSLLFETGQLAALAAADWRAWGAVVYMALGASIIAYGLWYHLIEKHAVNRVVPLTLLAPVLSVVFAVMLLAEPVTTRLVAGGLITLMGVAMIQFLAPANPAATVAS
jgi:O-acetylserine/cysteine efflux transporter